MKRGLGWLTAAAKSLRSDPLRLLLLIGAVALGVWLWESEKPWQGNGAKRIARGDRLAVEHYVAMWTWWAALANFGILLTLSLSRPWWRKWTQPVGGEVGDQGWPQRHWQTRGVPGWSVFILLLAMTFAAVYRGRLLDREIQRDEQDNLRRNIFGYHERQPDGTLIFEDISWQDTFFENRLANNPVLFSALSHASLEIWQKCAGGSNERFSLVAVRLPAYLAGIASLAAVWWALNVFGFIRAAPLAALLLAIHPYHADYTLQARGYSLVILFVTLASACLLRALNSGRWRWWWAFAASLVAMFYAYAGSVYAVIAMGSVGLAAVLTMLVRGRRETGLAQLSRLGVCGVVAAGGYLQLIAPSIPQVRVHLSQSFEKIPLHAEWYYLAYQKYFGGVRFLRADRSDTAEMTPTGYLTDSVILENPGLSALMLLVLPSLGVWGLVRAFRRDPLGGALLAAGLLAPLLSWIHNGLITGLYLYDWYWIYALPFLFMLIAIGATSWWSHEDAAEVRAAAVFGAERRLSVRRVVSIACVIFLAGWFFWETKPGRYGRPAMTLDVKGESAVFPRGDHNWVVYRDGRMIREPRKL